MVCWWQEGGQAKRCAEALAQLEKRLTPAWLIALEDARAARAKQAADAAAMAAHEAGAAARAKATVQLAMEAKVAQLRAAAREKRLRAVAHGQEVARAEKRWWTAAKQRAQGERAALMATAMADAKRKAEHAASIRAAHTAQALVLHERRANRALRLHGGGLKHTSAAGGDGSSVQDAMSSPAATAKARHEAVVQTLQQGAGSSERRQGTKRALLAAASGAYKGMVLGNARRRLGSISVKGGGWVVLLQSKVR